ncbi:YkvA family protein [Flavobacterium sp. XS2P14]|uniref:YkvA family protein n=1 Tax=Flavobacterium sp. XS2P14 TaxID=3401735 RepID=UPI003AAFCE74
MQLIGKLKQQARKLKSEVQVLILAYADKRTPLTAKILIGLTVGYLLSPIDLIPDFIPVIGYLDDLIIVPLLITLSIKLIPAAVLIEARQNVRDNPQKFKKSNWIFAMIIILIWLTLFYMAYRHFSYLWK